MDNYIIAEQFSLLSKLMDIHGENSFKAKSYSIAAFNIDKLPFSLQQTSPEKIYEIKGIGEALGKKILQIIRENRFPLLEEYIQKTPPGIIEMLQIKGIGPKKIATIWKEMAIETIGELLYACNENRLLYYKGFGAKTQEMVRQNIEFFLASKGRFLFSEIELAAHAVEEKLKNIFSDSPIALTGALRRNSEIIDEIEIAIGISSDVLHTAFDATELKLISREENNFLVATPEQLKIRLYHCAPENFGSLLFSTTGSKIFLENFQQFTGKPLENTKTEDEIFSRAGLPFIAPYLREGINEITAAQKNNMAEPLLVNDIKGIIHSHSNWSDGLQSLEEMAKACQVQGFEYLVISDHSQSAFYANGLSIERIKSQHAQVNELNEKLAPFKIFKSIESDILNDGRLDYPDEILQTFDLVIASVHSNLKMTEEKAMQRLLNAINNPFTTILGHPTGRLLLSRNGYPVNHQQMIDACAEKKVVIELNAHPRRLDIDWRWIPYVIEKNVLISIDPDAHSVEGMNDIYYGTLAARKAGITKKQNLSSFSLKEMEIFLQQQHEKRNTK